MRFKFDDLFESSGDLLKAKKAVRIDVVRLTEGFVFDRAKKFGKINVFDNRGKDIEGELEGNVVVVKRFHDS